MTNAYSLSHLPDHVLIRELSAHAARERGTTALVLAHLAEVDRRGLYRDEGWPSLAQYCTGALRMSEDGAAKRIQAARAAIQFPTIFDRLADGRLHLSAVVLLAPHLTPENAEELLEAATHQSKAAVAELVADRFAAPVPLLVAGNVSEHAPGHVGDTVDEHAPEHVEPGVTEHAPEHVPPSADDDPYVTLTFRVRRSTRDKLAYAQSLASHAVPSADLGAYVERAADVLVAHEEKRRFGAGSRSRSRASATDERYVPTSIRKTVWLRDDGRCTFVGTHGHRCGTRRHLQFDHVTPIARGGASTADNLRLRCRQHNQLEAERAFGRGFMDAKREAARAARDSARAERERLRSEEASRMAAADEIVPALRSLGLGAHEARAVAMRVDLPHDAPLDQRVLAAIRMLGPRRVSTAA